MLLPSNFYNFLKKNNIEFFVGVPDSLIKGFCNFLSKNLNKKKHIVAANEGTAIAIASGYNIAKNKIPFVYLQNSGLGNCINPILSLADKKVFKIPMIIMVGWRGQPGTLDEPQHLSQGQVTIPLIKSLRKKYKILDGNPISDFKKIKELISLAKKNSEPVFAIVKKNTFVIEQNFNKKKSKLLSREKAIELIVNVLKKKFKFIASTGMISRELYETRLRSNKKNINDFYTVGSMGHASQIALGVALNTNKKIVCLDGDGAFLMHMGGVSTIGSLKLNNFIHIVLNNNAHDSVGGQETTAISSKLTDIAKACGYQKIVGPIFTENEIKKNLKNLKKIKKGPVFIEIRVKIGYRKNIGRPKEAPHINKFNFFKSISNNV